jgi:non-specific serine/threonine protein kinase
MTIRPTERPQSIREWLALFGKKDVEEVVGGDDEPTRFFAHEVAAEEIVPVRRRAGLRPEGRLETQVPSDPSEVQFKRAGEETGASKKKPSAGDSSTKQLAGLQALANDPAQTAPRRRGSTR